MKTKKCIRCGKKIIKQPSESSNYWKTKRFCSVSCSMFGQKRSLGNILSEATKLKISNSKKGIQSWNKGLTKYTNKIVAQLGKKSGASRLNKPKKPFVIHSGYRCIFQPEHPRIMKPFKIVPEQILIMEKHIGRFLNKEEIVHHINSNKLDNRIENLRLFPNKSEHMRWHALYDKNSGLKYGQQIGHTVSEKSRIKISNSLKEWYKHNLHWQLKSKFSPNPR